MTKISDALTYGLTIRESANDGSDFTNPSADYRRLFLGEDGRLHLKDSSGTVTDTAAAGDITADTAWAAKGDLIVGTANNTAAVLTAGTNGKVLTAASGEATGLKWETGSAWSPDTVPSSPNAADDEFDALSGWTTLGSLGTSNVTDFPSQWHVVKANAGLQIHGIYKAAPSTPFTVTAKFADYSLLRGNYTEYGIALGDGTPTAWWSVSISSYNVSIQRDTWTNNTTRASSSNGTTNHALCHPNYLRLVVNSTSDVDAWFSVDGMVWAQTFDAQNPGFASKIGLVVSANGVEAEACVDWIRFT